MKNNSGFAPILIILIVVVLGGATYAVLPKSVLKEYFEIGDKPDQQDFSDTIDSNLNLQDDKKFLGLKQYDETRAYVAGDTVVKSDFIYQAKAFSEAQAEFKLDTAEPVTFRWTTLVPKPKEPVTYRIKVWQLMQGQNSTTAMRTNQPIVTKDVDNMTEATISGLYTGPCKPPYLCDFIWSVEVVSKTDTSTGAGEPATSGTTEATLSTESKSTSGGTQ